MAEVWCSRAQERKHPSSFERFPRSHGENCWAAVSSFLGLFLFSVEIINRESLWVCSCVCSTLAYSSPFLQPHPDLQLPWWTPRFSTISNTHLDASGSFRYKLLNWIFADVAQQEKNISMVYQSQSSWCEKVTSDISRQQSSVCRWNPQG